MPVLIDLPHGHETSRQSHRTLEIGHLLFKILPDLSRRGQARDEGGWSRSANGLLSSSNLGGTACDAVIAQIKHSSAMLFHVPNASCYNHFEATTWMSALRTVDFVPRG
jgi:hypothetical protein